MRSLHNVILLTDNTASFLFSKMLGPQVIASYLRKQNINVTLIQGLFKFTEEEIISVLAKKINSQTLFVGFSTTFFFNVNLLKQQHLVSGDILKSEFHNNWAERFESILKRIKMAWPELKIVFGGPPKPNLLSFEKYADSVFSGYSEDSLSIYLKKLIPNFSVKKYDFSEHINTYHDSDGLIRGETLTLELSRGCRFNCSFCSYPLRGTINPLVRSFISLEAELNSNYQDYNITKYIIADDTLNENNQKIELLEKVVNSTQIPLNYTAYLRLDCFAKFKKYQARALKETGLKSAFFGIESLNPKVGKHIGKKTDPEWIIDQLGEIKSFFGNELKITTSFIFGLPEDTEADINRWAKIIAHKDFPSDHKIIQPLYINKYTQNDILNYTSKFDNSYTKYGYEFLSDTSSGFAQDWVNKKTNICFKKAIELTSFWNSIIYKNPTRFLNFNEMVLSGYGLTDKQLQNFYINNPDHVSLAIDKSKKQFETYKSKILKYHGVQS